MKQDIENIIKKNLPEKKEPPHSDDEFIQIAKENGITITSENLSDIVKNMMLSMDNARFWEYRQGFNDCLSTIPVSLIADEVLKIVKLEIEKDLSHDANHFCKKYGEQFKECAMCYFERKLLSEHLSTNKENKNNE